MNDSKNYKALVQAKADLIAEQGKLFDSVAAGAEWTDEQRKQDDAIVAKLASVNADIARHERRREIERTAPAAAPAVLKYERGDNFANAFVAWARDGDSSGLRASGDFSVAKGGVERLTISAASNATDMNIGTAADGGNAVPTGFHNQIIARRDETMIAARLPLLKIPGTGTTVDVPTDGEADGEFVSTAEATTYDLDAPALGKASMTLGKYTKRIDISDELLEDTPTEIMAFLANFVARGMAKTHNSLLVTEVTTNGTNFKTFASATAIAFGEIEDILANNDLSDYMDEDGALAWVMRASTHGAIKKIVGSDRQYDSNVGSGPGGKNLAGYPVLYSQKVPAQTAGLKSVLFGNWQYVGWREGSGLTFLRDPYTLGVSGQQRLLYGFRTAYKVLQAEAVGFGTQL